MLSPSPRHRPTETAPPLTLRATPRNQRFRIGERVKGRLELANPRDARSRSYRITYFQDLHRERDHHRIPLARLILNTEHFDAEGHAVFGFDRRIDGLPYDDGHLRIHYGLSVEVFVTPVSAKTQSVGGTEIPLPIRNQGATYRMSTTTLPLVGRDHEPGMLILTTIFLILVVALGVLNAGAVALLGVLFLPVAAYFLHRAQRQRLFGKASLKVAEHDGQRWVVTLTTRRHIDLVDSLLRLSAHQVFLIRNNEGAFVEARRELYRQTTDLLEATLADAPAGEVCFLIPKPTRALPSSGVYERTGIEWRLTLIHRPAYWSTVSREWPVKVGLGPR